MKTAAVDCHPTAVVHAGARIAEGARIGPYSVIGEHVEIGRDTVIGPHVVIADYTTIGERCRVFQFASIGEVPQDMKFKGEVSTLEIGDENIFREGLPVSVALSNLHPAEVTERFPASCDCFRGVPIAFQRGANGLRTLERIKLAAIHCKQRAKALLFPIISCKVDQPFEGSTFHGLPGCGIACPIRNNQQQADRQIPGDGVGPSRGEFLSVVPIG